ncbi:MAG TPA: trypsin-like peptidase domain-containing protein, partial [Candidatus Bathyarchaeia archaeon]|nr:trypsin-like peptidase domain-containing protein [Candidatus Bathyarchaeia archaeon]
MKKLEIILIGVIIALSVTVIVQFSNGRSLSDLSQATIQPPSGSTNTPEQTSPTTPQEQAPTSPDPATSTTLPSESSSLSEIFKNAENSVVQITSKVATVDNTIIINGQPLESQSTRLGSGFVYDKEGYIITNNHVVEGTKTVNVTFIDGNTYSAKVVGTDPDNDLAVIKITDNFSDENLVPLAIGDSSKLEVGQQIIAIGNPFGLSDSMTTGIVSALGRLLPNQNVGFSIPDIIQVDAAINPGNSGGPLLNLQGQVVGISTAISTSTGDFSGVGFAIPSNSIERIVPILIKYGSYQHPFLGISGRTMDSDVAIANGLPNNFKGIMVVNVVSGGPADKAGIHAATLDNNNIPHGGDIITAIDNHPMKTIYDVIAYLDDEKSVGDKVVLTVDRA